MANRTASKLLLKSLIPREAFAAFYGFSQFYFLKLTDMEKGIALLKKEWIGITLIFLLSLVLYIAFYFIFQMSSYLTLNGVWNTLNYIEYKGSVSSVESGNVLYNNLIDLFKKTLNANSAQKHYRLLIYINAFFASLLNVSLYLFTRHLFQKRTKAIIWMLIHALNPGVFFLATSSEDIFPAYACYVWMLFAFYFYCKQYKIIYLIISCIFLAATFLLHWTEGVPALISLILILSWQNRFKIKTLILTNLLVALTLSTLFFLVSLYLSYPFLKIWYPGKSMDSMWISGISFYKIALLFFNSIDYFFTSFTVEYFQFNIWYLLKSVIVFSIFTVFIRLLYKQYQLNKPYSSQLNHLLILTFGVSIFGSAMNLIEQASDPQFLIQPQFIIFLLLLNLENKHLYRILSLFLITILLFVFPLYKLDNRFQKSINLVEQSVDINKSVIISDGFNPFTPWAKLSWIDYKEVRHYHFPSDLKYVEEMSDSNYMKMTMDSIQSYVKNGYSLVIIGFLNQAPEKLGTNFIGYDLTEKMNLTQEYFKTDFYIDTLVSDKKNPIFLLKPKENK